MKTTLTCYCLLLFSFVDAQTWEMAKSFSSGAQSYTTSMCTDQNKNIYVTGRSFYYTGGTGSYNYFKLWKFDYMGNIQWVDTLQIGDIKSVCEPDGDIYVAGGKIRKYNTTGTILWEVVSGNKVLDIAIHPGGGIVTVGRISINDTNRCVITRYDENGNCLWARTNEFPGIGTHITCDKLGYIYIAGDDQLQNTSGNHGILVKYSSSGNLLYNKTIPHWVNDIAIDYMNNLYITGWYNSAYPVNIQGVQYSCNNNSIACYLIKCDQIGNVLWHKILNGGLSEKISIDIDSKANVLATVNYTSLTLDSLTLNAPYNNSSNTSIIKFNTTGQILWYKSSEPVSSGAYCSTNAINIGVDDEINISGSIEGSNVFGSWTLVQSSMYSDLFIAKIKNDNNLIGINEVDHQVYNLDVFPNPAEGIFHINYKASSFENLQVTIFNSAGIKVYNEQILESQKEVFREVNLSGNAKGVYYIEIIADGKKSVEKLIIN